MKVIVITCNRTDWLLEGFAYSFNKYFSSSQEVTVLGYKQILFLPNNFQFESLGDDDSNWGMPLYHYFSRNKIEPFILFLDDMWIIEQVNLGLVNRLYDEFQNGVAKVDLSYWTPSQEHTQYGKGFILLDQNVRYRNTLQVGMWTQRYFMKFLRPGSPWKFEDDSKARNDGEKIISAPFHTVVCANILSKGKIHQGWVSKLPKEDYKIYKREGWLP